MIASRLNERLQLVEPRGPIDFGPSLGEEVKVGLISDAKTLPCKFFYDEKGSQIFEKITETEEYYPTRCEREILIHQAAEIANCCDQDTIVIELGSGSSSKTRILLEAFMHRHGTIDYVPIDISADFLRSTAVDLLERYPEKLRVAAVAGLYQDGLRYIKTSDLFTNKKKLICFLGGSIGNFDRKEAAQFLREIAETMNPCDRILIGIDLKKDEKTLEAAYNDSAGVTADFNLNLLARINRELNANFDLTKFRHKAIWNHDEGRIEMRIYSNEDQIVQIPNHNIHFKAEEYIHTENSYKYSKIEIATLAQASGFYVEKQWLDSAEKFSLSILKMV
eukprot:TRINITY_DN9522_c0_g1_i1.p1 TRINITY_DN9522_c0_g1~~TRINITY_DN9522_c0_g1_i1.p1  ORF type:complete len:335 (-),score=98.93 TRINITY_DN9522_c0_g1_i1:23-1027(-)